MTTFEYLAGAHTLILSFAMVRILSSVPHAVRPERRYWVHVSWLSVSIALCLFAFWTFLSYREVEWTLPQFIAFLTVPALIYVYSSLVAPTDPTVIESWQDYFFGVRIPLFATAALVVGVGICNSYIFMDVQLFDPVNITSYLALVIFAIGLASANPLVHAVLALFPPLLIVSTVFLIAQPDSLTR